MAIESMISADEAKRLAKKHPRTFPSEEVVSLANHMIKTAASRGQYKAAFPCPKDEAPYIKQRLELYGYLVLVVSTSESLPIYQVSVYWDEISFLNEKTISKKQFPLCLFTPQGSEHLKPYLPELFPEKEPVRVAEPQPINHDLRTSRLAKGRSD